MIELGSNIKLPDDAVTQTFAFLARRGAGKTYGAMKLAEGMLEIEAQMVALDAIGVWWGLRLAANGRSPGYSHLTILGGLHGDIPLEPTAGALVADLIVERGVSAVLDVSLFRKAERKRFAAEFAEQLVHRKKSAKSPLHIFLEESQLYVPQFCTADEARMLGAFEDVIKLGRNWGIGASLISQRPQAVNKEVLNQTEVLIVMQTNGAQERKAIEGWIVEHGLDVKNLVNELPSLPVGTAFLWSPSWLRKLEKVHIGKRLTFDASATPTLGKHKAVEPQPLRADDLTKLSEAMAATIERAKENDPKALRAEIARLKAQKPEVRIETVEVDRPVFPEGLIDAFVVYLKSLDEIAKQLHEAWSKAKLGMAQAPRWASATPPPPESLMRERGVRIITQGPTNPPPPPKTPSASAGADNASLGAGPRAILALVAQYDGADRDQISVGTGYKRSTRDAYIARLCLSGYAVVRGSGVYATDAGREALGPDYEPLPTGPALRDHWYQRLPMGERAILRVAVDSYPDPVSRDHVSHKTGYKRATRDAYILRLRSRKLVVVDGPGSICASEALF